MAIFVMCVLFSDWNAGRGIFGYQHSSNANRRATDRYCGPSDNSAIHYGNGAQPSKERNQDEKNSDYDSCQQWRSAEASERSAFWTKQQAIAGWAGVVIGFCTLIAAIAAAYFARLAAQAGLNVAEVERGFVFDQPKLHVSKYGRRGDIDYDPPVPYFQGTCGFDNFGRSPVILRKLRMDVAILHKDNEPVADETTVVSDDFPGGHILQPNQAWHSARTREIAIDPGNWAEVATNSKSLWIYGIMTYDDVYGTNRRTSFRWKYVPSLRRAVPHGGKPHNERT